MIVALLWLFSLAWDAMKPTLRPCLTIINLPPTQKTCLFTVGNKASVCVFVITYHSCQSLSVVIMTLLLPIMISLLCAIIVYYNSEVI